MKYEKNEILSNGFDVFVCVTLKTNAVRETVTILFNNILHDPPLIEKESAATANKNTLNNFTKK